MNSLFAEYARTRSVKVRNQLVKNNINLARKVAHSVYRYGLSEIATYEELEAEAMLALCLAIDKYDCRRSSFSSYAIPYIQGKLLQMIRDKGRLIRIPQTVQDILSRSRKFIEEFERINKRKPSSEEVCKALDISKTTWQGARGKNSKIQSLNSTYSFNENNLVQEEIEARLVSPDYSRAEADKEHLQTTWDFSLDSLEPNEKQAIELTYFQNKTTKQTCETLKCDRLMLKRLLRQALAKLAFLGDESKLAFLQGSELPLSA